MTRVSRNFYKLPNGAGFYLYPGEPVPVGAQLWNGYDYEKQEWVYQGKKDTRTLDELRSSIEAKKRLEYLREEIRAERISYSELAELQSLTQYIEFDDVELLQWAGVKE